MPPLTLPHVLLELRKFLLVWVTQILFHNNIYPQSAFSKAEYLDVVVHQCRAPELNEYVDKFANDMLRVLVEKDGGGRVHDVIVLVYDEANLHVLRRYYINFNQFVGLKSQISSLDFLSDPNKLPQTYSGRITLPNFSWDKIYTHFRSLIFFHVEELKRVAVPASNTLFFKLLLNVDNASDLTNVIPQPSPWIQLMSEDDPRRHAFVPLGEISVGFLCFDLHNEYVKG